MNMSKLSLHEVKGTLESMTGAAAETLSPNSYRCRCPVHADATPSLVVSEVNGKILFHCFAGCSYESIKQAIESRTILYSLDELKPSLPLHERKIVKVYDYRDEKGKLLYQKVRFEPKSFAIRHKVGRYYKWGMGNKPKILYNLPLVLKTDTIAIVEGEKDADNLTDLGIVSTCNIDGGGKWCRSYNKWLKDKNLLLFTDNDDTGLQRLVLLQQLLAGYNSLVIMHPLPGLSKKGDVSDYIKLGGTLEELRTLYAAKLQLRVVQAA